MVRHTLKILQHFAARFLLTMLGYYASKGSGLLKLLFIRLFKTTPSRKTFSKLLSQKTLT